MKFKRNPETREKGKQTKKEKEPKEKSAIKIKSNIKAGPWVVND